MALQARLWYNRSMKMFCQSDATNILWRDTRKVTSRMDAIVPSSEKLCPRCKTIKPTSEFRRDLRAKDGLFSYCKPCFNQWRTRDKENTPEGHRKCSKCHIVKPFNEFYPNKGFKGGVGYECRDCTKERQKRIAVLVPASGERVCNICGQSKPLHEFDKDKRTYDGARSYCKACQGSHKTRNRTRRKENLGDVKRCLKCDELKPLEAFSKRRGRSDGLDSYCKECNGKRERHVTALPLEKTCTHCKETRPAEEFYVYNGARSKDGLSGWCRECTKADARERGNRSYTSLSAKRASLHLLYGITLEEYEHMYQEQDGKCAACGNPETTMMRGKLMMLAVDHSHTTGEVRGLLCQNCNQALGRLQDDPERIRGLLKYLTERTSN